MSTSKSSKALAKRTASTALMAPPPAPKRIKRPAIILDEDTYSSAVAHIIRRDFFPGLAETDAQREYLNAIESGDKGWIRESGKTLTQIMTPVPGGRRKVHIESHPGKTPFGKAGETPKGWAGDTPVTVAGTDIEEDEERGKKPEVDLNLSLNAFQSKYISEDQESFSRIIDRQNAKRFEKNAWMRNGNLHPSKQRLAQHKVIEAAKSSSQQVALRPSQDLDKRPAAPTTHKHVPFNTLMFSPDSIEDWAPTRAQAAETASLAPPKAVLHHNTRLPAPETTNDIPRPPSPTMSAVRDAIAGRPRLTNSEAGYDGSETPRVNGYAFVDAVGPSRHHDDDDDDDAPTDLLERLGAKADPSPFTINDSNRRERLHHKMVERINTKNNYKDTSTSISSSSTNTPARNPKSGLGIFGNDTPKFLSAPTPAAMARLGMTPGGKKNVGNLTPAAQRLFEKVGGAGTAR
ncbi:nuclear protein DGCR14, partial [Dendryphion nanum]